MSTAAELKVLYDQAWEAFKTDPHDRDLDRAFRSIRAAWLRQDNLEKGIPPPQDNLQVTCRAVFQDESTEPLGGMASLSLRGVQREVTGFMKKVSYEPAGRWESQYDGDPADGTYAEYSRLFRRVS